MSKRIHSILITESYQHFRPAIDAMSTVDRLLTGIPQKYLVGLKTVVLTDSTGLNHQSRRKKTWSRKRKVRIQECAGLYHQAWQGEPAWIELFVDNAISRCPGYLLKVPFVRDLQVASVLYHEIGHHIHKTQAPRYREREDVADDWSFRLATHYIRHRYWYFWPLLYVSSKLFRGVRFIKSKLAKA
jgi:hypothetical protein